MAPKLETRRQRLPLRRLIIYILLLLIIAAVLALIRRNF